jgi:hypothetical protein
MVVRVADLFARGLSAGGPDAWSVIKGNLVNLATFVDAVVLEPGIPVFDYWYTGEEWCSTVEAALRFLAEGAGCCRRGRGRSHEFSVTGSGVGSWPTAS